MSEKPPQQPEKPEVFNAYKFIQKLSLLEVELFGVIQKLEQAMQEEDEKNVTKYMTSKTRLTNDMFRHLAHAFIISNGDVCRLPQFNPNNERHYIRLSLPCSPKFLWGEVQEWLANEGSPEEKEDNPEEKDKSQVAKGETIDEAFTALLKTIP